MYISNWRHDFNWFHSDKSQHHHPTKMNLIVISRFKVQKSHDVTDIFQSVSNQNCQRKFKQCHELLVKLVSQFKLVPH